MAGITLEVRYSDLEPTRLLLVELTELADHLGREGLTGERARLLHALTRFVRTAGLGDIVEDGPEDCCDG